MDDLYLQAFSCCLIERVYSWRRHFTFSVLELAHYMILIHAMMMLLLLLLLQIFYPSVLLQVKESRRSTTTYLEALS